MPVLCISKGRVIFLRYIFKQSDGDCRHIVLGNSAVFLQRPLQKQVGELLRIVRGHRFQNVVKIGGRAERARDPVAQK